MVALASDDRKQGQGERAARKGADTKAYLVAGMLAGVDVGAHRAHAGAPPRHCCDGGAVEGVWSIVDYGRRKS